MSPEQNWSALAETGGISWLYAHSYLLSTKSLLIGLASLLRYSIRGISLRPPAHNSLKMNTKPLTHAEYEARLKSITSPEDAAAFAQEILASVTKDELAPESERPVPPVQHRRRMPRQPDIEKDELYLLPWYDVVANDNEAMVISLYAKGLTTRDISSYMRSHHGIELSQPGVSTITDKVFPLVKEWQARALAPCYPIVYLDGIHFKVRDAGKINSKVAYIVLGINPYGIKEVLGIWVSDTEGAKFWMHVLNELKNRGVDDILIACVDGLKGFPEAIKTIYPQTEAQICIVHQIRHTIKFLPPKDLDAFCKDLRYVYTALNESAGLEALHEVMEKWPQYRGYLKSWEDRWSDLAPFFNYPGPIRRMIYTTNAIENMNRQFRKVTKTTTIFPHDDALIKLLWLAQADMASGRTVAVRNWSEAMAQMSILFGDRIQF